MSNENVEKEYRLDEFETDNIYLIIIRAIGTVALILWNVYELSQVFLSLASIQIQKSGVYYYGELSASLDPELKKCMIVDGIALFFLVYMTINIKRIADGKEKLSLLLGISYIFIVLFVVLGFILKFVLGALVVGGAFGLVVFILGFILLIGLEIITLGGMLGDLSGIYNIADGILYIAMGIGGLMGGVSYAVFDKGPFQVLKDILDDCV